MRGQELLGWFEWPIRPTISGVRLNDDYASTQHDRYTHDVSEEENLL